MQKNMTESMTSSHGMRKSVIHPNIDIKFKKNEEEDELFCKETKEIKEYICCKDFDNYKQGDVFTQHSANNIQDQWESKGNTGSFPIMSFARIIKRKKDSINEIRGLDVFKINKTMSAMNVDCQKALNILNEKVSSIPKLIESFVTETQEHVFGRVKGCSETMNKIKEFKDEIDGIELSAKGDPILKNIGERNDLKKDYINLARFLLQWKGIGDIKVDYSGITENLKNCIINLNEMRAESVKKYDLLMTSLLGNVYEFIFGLEHMEVDEEFRKKFRNEYINETYVASLKNQFQIDMQGKDDRISELEALLKKQKSEISGLNSLNSEYKLEIEKLNGDMVSMKLEFEKKIKSALTAVKTASEKKITDISDTMNEWKNKFNDLDALYNKDSAKLNLEIKTLTTNYKNQINELEVKIGNLEDQLDLIKDERDKFSKKNKDLNNQLIELKTRYSEFESKHHETCEANANDVKALHADYKGKIAALEANIKKLNITIQHLTEENEDLDNKYNDTNKKLIDCRLKFNDLTKKSGDESTKLTVEIKNLKEEHETMVNGLNGKLNLSNSKLDNMTKDRDQARAKIEELTDDLDHTQDLLNSTEVLVRQTEKNYKIMVGDRDGEINTLTSTIDLMKNDWEDLTKAYDLLDVEIKKQLCCNDELRNTIRQLTSNNLSHNDYINDHEAEMKGIFEQFVRCALKKKTIDFNDPTDKVNKCEENATTCRGKLSTLKNEKPNQSSCFSTITTTLQKIKGGNTTFTEVKFPRQSQK